MSYPTMELPITLALTYPERVPSDVLSIDFSKMRTLTFEELKEGSYPCFDIVKECAKKEMGYPLVVNAANEVLVKAFLDGKINYLDIEKYLKKTVDDFAGETLSSFEEMESLDIKIRGKTEKMVNR